MAKNRNLIKNTRYNFKLRSRPNFFIGTYFILGTQLIKTVISDFSTVDSPFSFLTVNFLEFFIFLITFLVFLFSTLAIFIDSRRYARKIGNKVWNQNSKKLMWYLYILVFILYLIEYYLLRTGEEAFIIPTFIMGYGILLLALNFSKKTPLYLFSIACFLIGFMPLFVDGSGLYSLIILGIGHFVYSIFLLNKKEIKNTVS